MQYHDKLKILIHKYILFIYRVTKYYPKEEMYGLISQFRRAGVSIMLNYIEGFGRRRGEECKTYNNFLEISYGSLKETKYILFLSLSLNYINDNNYGVGLKLSHEIGAMIWPLLK